jgi:hypothetical protein
MKIINPSIVLLILASSCSLPESPERVALIYGVSIYGAGYNLTYTDDDARGMVNLLVSQNWTDIRPRIDQDTTKVNIAADIGLLDSQRFKGTVLFYYAGHGYYVDGVQYIAPAGSISSTGAILLENMISPDELFSWFKAAGLQHVIIILDSCYSGGFVEAGATTSSIPPIFGPNEATDGNLRYTKFLDALSDSYINYLHYSEYSGYIVISAAGSLEFSYEQLYGHGVFTYFVLQSAQHGDLNSDGVVTTSELFAYAVSGINHYWNSQHKNTFGKYEQQYWDFHPHLTGSPREYILFKTVK